LIWASFAKGRIFVNKWDDLEKIKQKEQNVKKGGKYWDYYITDSILNEENKIKFEKYFGHLNDKSEVERNHEKSKIALNYVFSHKHIDGCIVCFENEKQSDVLKEFNMYPEKEFKI
jgi:hypothetical protein